LISGRGDVLWVVESVATVQVSFAGIASFREGQGVIATGRLHPEERGEPGS
jgi:cytochrome c-type biogenesis protein CcmE